MKLTDSQSNSIGELLNVMHRLRLECPWDREQTLDSLRTFLLEEAYECVQAIDDLPTAGAKALVEELGDVLLQVVFQSELLAELEPSNNFFKVVEVLTKKLIYRHPHVFGETKAADSTEVLKNWDALKAQEKKESPSQSFLDGIPKAMTALQTANKLGKKSEKVGFDWDKSEGAWTQFESEIKELQESKSFAEKEDELGDVLFCLSQWARHEKIDPEVALLKANQKFRRRCTIMEQMAQAESKDFKSLSLEEKETLWKKAKNEEKNR